MNKGHIDFDAKTFLARVVMNGVRLVAFTLVIVVLEYVTGGSKTERSTRSRTQYALEFWKQLNLCT